MAEAAHHRALTSLGLPANGPGHEVLSWAGVEAWLLLARSREQPLADVALAIRTALALAALGHRPDAEDAHFANEALDAALPHILAEIPDAAEALRPRFRRLKVFLRLLATPEADVDAVKLDVYEEFHDEAALIADICDAAHRINRLNANGRRLEQLEVDVAAKRANTAEASR